MPSWSIHLKIAKGVNEKLKLDRDNFYYGNLIPDVDKDTKIGRYKAHYYNSNLPFFNCPKEEMIDIDKFLKDYKKNLNNPLVLGYYSHLLTDNYFNDYVYSNCWVLDKDKNIIGIKLKNGNVLNLDLENSKKIRQKYKHRDFELYGKYLFFCEKFDLNFDNKKIIENIDVLNDRFLNIELVNNRIKYLNTGFKKFNRLSLFEKIFKHRYVLFDKNELDRLIDDCTNYVVGEIEKIIG